MVHTLENNFGGPPINCQDWCGIDITDAYRNDLNAESRMDPFSQVYWQKCWSLCLPICQNEANEGHNIFSIQVWHAMYESMPESLLHAQVSFMCIYMYIYIYSHTYNYTHTNTC